MALEFYNIMKAHAEADPDHIALIDIDQSYTYRELIERIEKFAGALGSLNLNPQSKMGILCLNQQEYLTAFLAGLLKGIPIIPLNFLLNPDDLVFIAMDAGIDTLVFNSCFVKPETAPFFNMFPNRIRVGSGENDALLAEGTHPFEGFLGSGNREQSQKRHQRPDHFPDVILYTSGTTARPKGVMLYESQFFANCEATFKHLPFRKDDRVIMALPLFHSFGNIIALIILMAHGTLILLPQFAPKSILNAIHKHQATILPLVPTIYSFLVDLYKRGGYDVPSLRYCISGGAALPLALLRGVEETLEVTVIEGYGLTETSPVIAVNTFADGSVPGSVGPVLDNLEVQLVDEAGQPVPQGEVGEIWVRGPSITQGYWNNPEETQAALTPEGWFKTGDLGHMDENNRLYISAGRKKDLIIRAGENISPLAIENALMNHPGIAEVAAIGLPHERMGEQVKVCAVLHEGASVEVQELKDFCRQNLPAFMAPDIIQIYPELPKTATGKILKAQLREES